MRLSNDNIEVNMEGFEEDGAVFAGRGVENRVDEYVNNRARLQNNNIQENRKIASNLQPIIDSKLVHDGEDGAK